MATAPISVLMFEDDESQALLTREALEQSGCHVEVCHNGRDGLARMFTRDYQVYLVDIKLPDINGVELLRRITAVKPGAVVIVVTGHGDEMAAVEAMKLGAYDYIVKSPSMGHLAALPFVIREGTDRNQLKHEREALQTEIWEHARLLEERNAELRRLHKDLKQFTRLKTDLMSVIAYGLQQPLIKIRESLAVFSSGFKGASGQDENFAAALFELEQMEHRIADLQEMVRIGTGRIDLLKRFVDPGLLIQQVSQVVRPGLEPQHVQVVIMAPTNAAPVFADPDKMGHAIRMMIGFAKSALDGPGRITVRWDAGQAESTCSVVYEAQGSNLPPAAWPSRGVPMPPGWPEGDLGLAVGRRIIEHHGGNVWANPSSGRCGCLGFMLPKRSMQEAFGEYLRQGIEIARQDQRGFSVIAFVVQSVEAIRAKYGPERLSKLLLLVEERLNEMIRQQSGDRVIRGPNGEMAVILA